MSAQNTARLLTFESGRSGDLDKPVLIDPGTYEAVLVDWKTGYSGYFKKNTLRMRFRITEQGKFHGMVIPGWFNVELTKSKTTVKAGWRSDFLRMYQDCFDIRLDRRDRIPVNQFKLNHLSVEVWTISKDSQGQPLTNVNHYSRVKRVLKIIQ